MPISPRPNEQPYAPMPMAFRLLHQFERFLEGIYQKGIQKGHKRQISLTIAPELLQRVDELAKRTGQGRAGIINLAIYRALEGVCSKGKCDERPPASQPA